MTNARFGRRTLVVGGASAAAAALLAGPARAEGWGHAVRAMAAYDAMQRYFYDPPTGYYLEEYPRTGGTPGATSGRSRKP